MKVKITQGLAKRVFHIGVALFYNEPAGGFWRCASLL
jgi:hypothetical protein